MLHEYVFYEKIFLLNIAILQNKKVEF